GITYFSSAHAPRSICLQRCEQNGRYWFASVHSTFAEHVGQLTIVAIAALRNPLLRRALDRKFDQKLHSVSSNGTSVSIGLGFMSPSCSVKRTHSRYLLAEISGIAPRDSSSVSRSI